MANSGEYPKANGDIYYAPDANMAYYQGAMAATLNHGAVTVGTGAITIKAANTSRKSILIRNNGSTNVFIGPSGVTATNGYKMTPGKCLYLVDVEIIYGISDSGSNSVRYLESQ